MHVSVRFFGLAVMIVMTLSDVLAQRQPVVSTRWGALLGGNFNMAGIGWAQWVSDPKRPGGQSAEAATYFSDDYQFNMSYAGIEPHVKFFLDDNLHLTAGVGLSRSNGSAAAESAVW